MPRLIAIANQKGGVGKTTTSVNLAAALAARGQRVLLVDLDPQCNATTGSGVVPAELDWSSGDLLLGRAGYDQVLQDTEAGYAMLPANAGLTAAEVELLSSERKELRLREALAAAGDFDQVLMDCPPSLNMLTVNALVAANEVIIPVQCEYYAMEGLRALLETIGGLRRRFNPGLAIGGLLRTMYSPSRLGREVSGQLQELFGERLLNTVIPRNVRLAEAPSHGQPVVSYDRRSRGAEAYMALAGELLDRWRGGGARQALVGGGDA